MDTNGTERAPVGDAPEIPSGLRRLWEEPAPPRRGPKPTLDLDRITAAAIELADAEGLDALSMARVASSLGYSSMALYRYVDSKDDLFVLMADAAAGPPPELSGCTGWRDALRLWTTAQLRAIMRRPWFIELPLTSSLTGPNRLRWIDTAFEALSGVRVGVEVKLKIVGLLSQHVLGETRIQIETWSAAAARVRRAAGLPEDTPMSALDPAAVAEAHLYGDFATVLTHYADPARYPALFGALAADPPPRSPGPGEPAPDPGVTDWIEQAGWGVDIVLDGIAELIAREEAAPAP